VQWWMKKDDVRPLIRVSALCYSDGWVARTSGPHKNPVSLISRHSLLERVERGPRLM